MKSIADGHRRPDGTNLSFHLSGMIVVSFAAVFRLVTQRSSPQTAVCGEERCVTSLKTAGKETRMIADHRRNLGRVGKIKALPILQICPRSSQTIGDIYDFEFSLVGKIWDGRETVPSGIFPDI